MPLGLQDRLSFITAAGKILSSSLQSQTTLQRLAELISSTIADVCAIELFRDGGTRERVATAFPKNLADVESVMSGSASQPDPVFLIPLPIDGGTLGVMTLVRLGSEMSIEDLTMAEDVARWAALSVENARLYQTAQEALLTVRNQAANIRHLNTDLEKRVIQRTIQLEAANREMSVVNYTVSHDLRAPLRAIDGYSQMLLEDYGNALPEGAKAYVEQLSASTREVNRLLDGLLSFCKISSQVLKPQSVDVNEIVKRSIETLQTKMTGRQIEMRLNSLDATLADPLLLKQVFVNLLSNAITYTSNRDIAVIEVGQIKSLDSDEQTFFVKDNGVGFDPADEEKLFEAFRRLHTDRSYEGTGVGLSIVAAIVQRHGGRIWAKGIPGSGATFYFTLGDGSGQNQRIA